MDLNTMPTEEQEEVKYANFRSNEGCENGEFVGFSDEPEGNERTKLRCEGYNTCEYNDKCTHSLPHFQNKECTNNSFPLTFTLKCPGCICKSIQLKKTQQHKKIKKKRK